MQLCPILVLLPLLSPADLGRGVASELLMSCSSHGLWLCGMLGAVAVAHGPWVPPSRAGSQLVDDMRQGGSGEMAKEQGLGGGICALLSLFLSVALHRPQLELGRNSPGPLPPG